MPLSTYERWRDENGVTRTSRRSRRPSFYLRPSEVAELLGASEEIVASYCFPTRIPDVSKPVASTADTFDFIVRDPAIARIARDLVEKPIHGWVEKGTRSLQKDSRTGKTQIIFEDKSRHIRRVTLLDLTWQD